jgi:hypothetical protein
VRSLKLFIAVLPLLIASRAEGSPLIDLVGTVGGEGGAQGVVSGGSPASTYFNPAMLVGAGDSVTMSFLMVSAQIGVSLDRRSGGEVPRIVGARGINGADGKPIPNDVVPTQWLRNGCDAGTAKDECPAPGFPARPRQRHPTDKSARTYVVLGLVKQIVPDRFAIGMYGILPVRTFTSARAFYADEREALFSNSLHPELYGDRLTAVSLVFGAAFKVIPSLSIGAGVSLGLLNAATASTYVRDQSDYDTLLLNNSVQTAVNVSPTLGARWMPRDWVRIGGSLQSPQSFVIETEIAATVPSGTESRTTRRDVFHYMPWAIRFGAEVDALRGPHTVSLTASMNYALWSNYLDRHGNKPAVYGEEYAFHDTLSGAVGVRWAHQRVRVYLDGQYVPTPVPLQTGRSNYVDNTRVGAVLGGDIDLGIGGIHAGLQLFGHRLLSRHQKKDASKIRDELPDDAVFADSFDAVPGAGGLQTNNPGFPGFSSSGWVTGFATTLRVPL